MPAEMLADAYGYTIEKGNDGIYKDLVLYIGMPGWTPTLEQCMEHVATCDTSRIKFQQGSGCSPSMNTMTKAPARKMDSKKGGTNSIAGMAKDDGLTCNNSGQVGHISQNCPNCDLMNKLLEQALVGKDAPRAKSGRPNMDNQKGSALTGRKESVQLAENTQAKQETDSAAESKLESLSDSDSEVGKGKAGQ